MFMGASVVFMGMDIGIFMGIDMFIGIFIGMLMGMVMLSEMDLLSNMVMVLLSDTTVMLSCGIIITDKGILSGVMLTDIDSLADIVMFSSTARATPKESIKRMDASIIPINIEHFISLSTYLSLRSNSFKMY
jgi:hypothetical protein